MIVYIVLRIIPKIQNFFRTAGDVCYGGVAPTGPGHTPLNESLGQFKYILQCYNFFVIFPFSLNLLKCFLEKKMC